MQKGGRSLRPPFCLPWLDYFFLVAFFAVAFLAAFFVAICLFSLVNQTLTLQLLRCS